jgi:hypothetical protein
MAYKAAMSAKTPQTSTKAAEYSYAHVEAALAATFGVDVTGKVGWLRGRIQHLRRLGLTPPGPGKGATIRYRLDDVDRWLLALELEHFRIDPTGAVAAVKNNWSGPGMLRDLVAKARASKDDKSDVLITVDFGPLSRAPVIGHTTLKAIGAFGAYLAGPRPPTFGVVCRASIFNLSARVRALDLALAAPPPPPLPGGVAGFILKSGRRARGER